MKIMTYFNYLINCPYNKEDIPSIYNPDFFWFVGLSCHLIVFECDLLVCLYSKNSYY